MPQTLFSPVKDDLLPVFETIEDGGALRYVKADRSLSPDYDSFNRGAEIPNLGKATSESAISSETFLVADPQTEINVRVVEQVDGIRSFHIDQLANPDTVTFSSGGIWKPSILLYGRVATASDTPQSKRFMRRFQAAIKRHFTKIGACYVGPKAFEEFRAGKRLALAEQSPRESDLTMS